MASEKRKIYELHDSKTNKIEITTDKEVFIEFEHIPTYYEKDENKYDIWSNNIIVHLIGIRDYQMTGTIDKDDYIMDGKIITKDNEELILFDSYNLLNSVKMELKYWSGCKVIVSYDQIKLIKERMIEKYEEWNGSLEI